MSVNPAKQDKTIAVDQDGKTSKRKVSARGSKQKGSQYERELAEFLTEHLGIEISRMPMSGAATYGTKIGGADLLGTPMIHAELKRTERLNVREALVQAEDSVAASRLKDKPVVITRRNREKTEDSLVVLRLKDFLPFYKLMLAHLGYTQVR